MHAGIHPQAATPLLPRSRHPPGTDGYCCGRYASYLNAFLFHKRLSFCSQVGGMHARGGACVPRGWGHAYLGGVWPGACVAGETATTAGGMHPTGMHSC